jgi:hypothetical protein
MEQEIRAIRNELRQLVTTDSDVAELIRELEDSLSDEEAIEYENLVNFSSPEVAVGGILLFFIAYVLRRLAKDILDYQRALNETEIAQRRLDIIQDMVRDGVPIDVADGIVTRLLAAIAKRTKDDPALKRVLDHATKYLPSSADNGEPHN